MNSLETFSRFCPYCGEPISLLVDCTEPEQRYIEDCQVCCRPIVVDLCVRGEDDIELRLYSEDDAL